MSKRIYEYRTIQGRFYYRRHGGVIIINPLFTGSNTSTYFPLYKNVGECLLDDGKAYHFELTIKTIKFKNGRVDFFTYSIPSLIFNRIK